MPKIYAFYLPQFYRTLENDEWWGEGFTDWVTVKNAKPLFEGHVQPREPMEYYDLLEKETMQRQADLMDKYSIDGFCFYHYYFENGKKILEKPAENLLKWKDIRMPFCFYWANQTWIKSWSNIEGGNVWTYGLGGTENKTSDDNGILLKQSYGGEKDWLEHIEYLMPFFEDKRYIKIDGRPIFIIYMPEDIKCFSDMKKCWDKFMDENGKPHVYFIGRNSYGSCMDGYMDHEPKFAIQEMVGRKYNNDYGIMAVLDYDEVWRKIIANAEVGDNYFYGGFVGFDTTPRQGKNRGIVIAGQTPQKFKKYLVWLLIKAINCKNDIVFLNAWNEWGESMYLEPDILNGEAYLKAVKEAKFLVESNKEIFQGMTLTNMNNMMSERIDSLLRQNERYRNYWEILRDWLNIKVDGKKILKYLTDSNVETVAIYGMGMLGAILYKELCDEGICVKYGIDKDVSKNDKFDIPIVALDDEFTDVDLIIISVVYDREKIKDLLKEKINVEVMFLYEILSYAKQ